MFQNETWNIRSMSQDKLEIIKWENKQSNLILKSDISQVVKNDYTRSD